MAVLFSIPCILSLVTMCITVLRLSVSYSYSPITERERLFAFELESDCNHLDVHWTDELVVFKRRST